MKKLASMAAVAAVGLVGYLALTESTVAAQTTGWIAICVDERPPAWWNSGCRATYDEANRLAKGHELFTKGHRWTMRTCQR